MWHRHRGVHLQMSGRNASRPAASLDACVGSGGLAVLAENSCAPGLHRGRNRTLGRMTVKVRFAPSPTGSLHVGNALGAVATRRFGDWMLLRIDDTDAARNVGVVDAEKHPVAEPSGRDRAERIADMKRARRARRKADFHCHPAECTIPPAMESWRATVLRQNG